MSAPHVKHDAGKPRFSLMPGYRAWAPIVAVLQWAVDVKGYPAHNWQLATDTGRYRDALARHFAAWLDDPRGVDAESGLSHLAHMGCCLLFLLWHGDDRPVLTGDPITETTVHIRTEAGGWEVHGVPQSAADAIVASANSRR